MKSIGNLAQRLKRLGGRRFVVAVCDTITSTFDIGCSVLDIVGHNPWHRLRPLEILDNVQHRTPNSELPTLRAFRLGATLVFLVAFVSCKDTGPVASPGTDIDRTLKSLTKVNDHPLYTMKFYGDYGFAQRVGLSLSKSSASFFAPLRLCVTPSNADSAWGCTCFVGYGNSSDPQFGRNFDWHDCIPLILFTNPPNGYASVSTVDLEYLGYTRTNLPDRSDQTALLQTPWYPFDGMNEKGVTVGMMAVPSGLPPYDPRKTSLGELGTIRLVLDFAATTDEAIALLGQYNLRMDDPPVHYLIADATGHSAVIEYVNGTMSVLRNTEPWHVSTNFIITGSSAPTTTPCWRYDTAYRELKASNGVITGDGALGLLGRVSQSSTMWSVVYGMTSGKIRIATDRNYSGVLGFGLRDNLPPKQ